MALKEVEPKNIYVRINVPDYTVLRKNRDNTVLETDLNVMEWTTPTYNWATPTRSWYNFTWWNPTPAPIYSDTDYTAQFELPYLCFTAKSAGAYLRLDKRGSPTSVTLETSTDWSTRTTYTFWTYIILSNVGDKVYWRNTSTTTTGFSTAVNTDFYNFVTADNFDCSWDITYLLNKNWTTTLSNSCFVQLFTWCSKLYSAPELPATTLANNCYWYMFQNCANLTTPPKLPATTLAEQCYRNMFSWCTNLTALPKLSALYYNNISCYEMFKWCSKIKLSTSKTWDYQTAYRIPTSWSGSTQSTNSLYNMFANTGWTFTWTPTINTTYYTSNTLV